MSEKKEVVLRACTKCGKMFYVRKGKENKCSACRREPHGQAKRSVTKTCAHCGAKFEVSSYMSRKIYCSKRCSSAVWKEKCRQNYAENKGMRVYHCICKKCGNAFESQYPRKTCFECAEKRTESGRKIKKVCECCGKPFEVPKYESFRRFCSRDCSVKGFKKNRNGALDEYKKSGGDVFEAVMKIAEKNYPERVKKLRFSRDEKAKVRKILFAVNARPNGDPFAWFYNHILFPVAGIDYRATPEKERELVQMLALALGTIWTKKTTVQPAETDYKW